MRVSVLIAALFASALLAEAQPITDWHTFKSPTATTLAGQGTSSPVFGSPSASSSTAFLIGYFDALSEGNYQDAYKLLCDDAQEDETPAQFTARVSSGPRITSYEVGDVAIPALTVPADVTYATGGQDRLEITLAQDAGTGQFEVCGIAG